MTRPTCAKELTVIVCGGRDFHDYDAIKSGMEAFERKHGRIDIVIHGGAKGADWLGAGWALANDRRVHSYPADWSKHGPAAGPIRNARMLREGKPDFVIAFPGGRGTANMVRQAKEAGVTVVGYFGLADPLIVTLEPTDA